MSQQADLDFKYAEILCSIIISWVEVVIFLLKYADQTEGQYTEPNTVDTEFYAHAHMANTRRNYVLINNSCKTF